MTGVGTTYSGEEVDQNIGNVVKVDKDIIEHFVYQFRQNGKKHILRVPVPIPLKATVKELAYRIIQAHRIACYVEDGKVVTLCYQLLC